MFYTFSGAEWDGGLSSAWVRRSRRFLGRRYTMMGGADITLFIHSGQLQQMLHLQRRGYQETEVEKAIQQATTKQRVDCLQPRVRKTDNTRTPLVVTHHPSLPNLGNITRQHQHLLQLSRMDEEGDISSTHHSTPPSQKSM